MEVQYLKEFVVLAKIGNFQEAADESNISQPSLSRHIKLLETEINAPLFVRTTRKVSLSDFGRALLPIAEKIAGLHADYFSAVENIKANAKGKLVIGAIPALAPYNITAIMAEYNNKHPHSDLNLIEAGTDDLRQKLIDKKCELAFIRESGWDNDEFEHIPYLKDSIVAVVHDKHKFATQKSVSLIQLKAEPLLLVGEHTWLYQYCVRQFNKIGVEPNIIFTDGQINALMDLAVRGMGVAFIMKRLAEYYTVPHTVILDIEPEIGNQINVCYLKNRKLSQEAKHFLACIPDSRRLITM